MIDAFERLRILCKPVFSWVPPYIREKIMYPYITRYTKPLVVSLPEMLVLELSNICNLKCKMCNRPSKDIRLEHMELSLAKDILKKAHDLGIKKVAFHTIGEPLLYPKLAEILTFAKGLGFPLLVSTNANLLTRENADMLIDVGIDILRVSLEGTSKIYNFIREGGDFETAINNIEYFYKKKKRGIPKIHLHYIITKETIQCINEFQQKYSYLFDEILFSPLLNPGYRHNEYVARSSVIALHNDRYPCVHLWTTMYITSGGEVSVCCYDYDRRFTVGNIKNAFLQSIWNSEGYRRYRKLHREGKISATPLCRNCSLPLIGSTFYMKRFAHIIRKVYGLDIKILIRF